MKTDIIGFLAGIWTTAVNALVWLVGLIAGIDPVQAVGTIVVLAGAGLIITMVMGTALIWYFKKTNKVVFPRLTMAVLNIVETHIKSIMLLLNMDDNVLFLLHSEVVRKLYLNTFKNIPVKDRAIFMPQCLRSQKCPAPTNKEGIQCKSCGQCELTKIKKEAEALGYRFFIAPGGTLVKRMLRKYHPKAIIGVGCKNEVQMGCDLAIRHGVIPIAIPLLRDGCVETLVDYDELRYVMNLVPECTKA